MIYPEKALGKEFWKRVYERAQAELGTGDIPLAMFNKVWIVTDRAAVYMHKDRNNAGKLTAIGRFRSGDFNGITPVIIMMTPVQGLAPIPGFEPSGK